MINTFGKVAGAIGKFAMEHKEEAVEIGKKALSAVALLVLDSIRKKIEDKGKSNKYKKYLFNDYK